MVGGARVTVSITEERRREFGFVHTGGVERRVVLRTRGDGFGFHSRGDRGGGFARRSSGESVGD